MSDHSGIEQMELCFDRAIEPAAYSTRAGLSGFDEFNEEIIRFRESALYLDYFDRFMQIVCRHSSARPIISKDIEKELGLGGAQVRDLVRYARWMGCPVISSGKGYAFAVGPEELDITIAHMEERTRSMLFTIIKLRGARDAMTKPLKRCDGYLKLEEVNRVFDR